MRCMCIVDGSAFFYVGGGGVCEVGGGCHVLESRFCRTRDQQGVILRWGGWLPHKTDCIVEVDFATYGRETHSSYCYSFVSMGRVYIFY